MRKISKGFVGMLLLIVGLAIIVFLTDQGIKDYMANAVYYWAPMGLITAGGMLLFFWRRDKAEK